MGLEYKFINKDELVIVTLKGRLVKENQAQLIKCTDEFQHLESKVAIIYFKDVTNIDKSAHRLLSLLQQAARKKEKKLFICGLNTTQKKELLDKGIVRHNEIKADLEELLKEL